MKFVTWSNATSIKAFKIKFSCGTSGYQELLKQGYPLPALRTLRRKLEKIRFSPGILHEVFEFLKLKVDNFKNNHERECVIVIDEMAITPSKSYDTATKVYLGDVNLPCHSSDVSATHALVIMLGGITTRWKQTVAYFFTGNSVDGSVYRDILFQIIEKTEAVGLKVVSITSDMGSANQAFWKICGITAGRYSLIKNFIQHPYDDTRKIYIFADVPHLFKNIKNMLISNKLINLADSITDEYKLPSNTVKASHIVDIIKYQEPLQFKLVPKLSEADLMPSHFQKMKVRTSTNVISRPVSSALRFLSNELKITEYNTTAWFIDIIETWFTLMSSRHPSVALSLKNMQAYDEAISHLQKTMSIFQRMNVGSRNLWKPSQTGLLISTKSMLDIQEDCLKNKGYAFILTSRFTQDCLENLFSAVRARQVIPNAVQFKAHLKLITVGQYLKDVSKSSYDADDRQFLADFLDTPLLPTVYQEVTVPENFEPTEIVLNNSELNSLYNVCGYMLKSIQKNAKVCSACMDSVGSKKEIDFEYANLVHFRCFRKNSLYYCNKDTFVFFLKMETIFRQYFEMVSKQQNVNIKDFFVNKCSVGCQHINHIVSCHNLKNKIINRFIIFRLKIAEKNFKDKKHVHASKSLMASTL